MARTITFKELLHGVATRMGLDPVGDGLQANQAEALAEYLSDSYETCYEWYQWPESICVEQVTALDQVIEWDQTTALDGIGTVFCISTSHPLKAANPGWIQFQLGEEGVYLPTASASSEVWISYRPPAPEFTATVYDASVAYAVGDLVYLASTGHCYRCTTATTAGTAPTSTGYWRVQPILRLLKQATIQGAYAEALAEDGQHQTSLQADARQQAHLEDEMDRIELQSGQTRTITFKNPALS